MTLLFQNKRLPSLGNSWVGIHTPLISGQTLGLWPGLGADSPYSFFTTHPLEGGWVPQTNQPFARFGYNRSL